MASHENSSFRPGRIDRTQLGIIAAGLFMVAGGSAVLIEQNMRIREFRQTLKARDAQGPMNLKKDIPLANGAPPPEFLPRKQDPILWMSDAELEAFIRDCSAKLQKNPNDAAILEQRGDAYVRKEMKTLAAADYRQALKIVQQENSRSTLPGTVTVDAGGEVIGDTDNSGYRRNALERKIQEIEQPPPDDDPIL